MKPVSTIEGRAYPLGLSNVDTDVIIGAEWLKTTTRTGLGRGAFESLRKNPANAFDHPAYSSAPILLAGDNFGCGSSREHAAWALLDLGIQAVIAPSFSDIFASNAFKNGILTLTLRPDEVELLLKLAEDEPIRIDLKNQTVTTPRGNCHSFEIDPFRKHCLLHGLDEIDLTLESSDGIAAYESEAARRAPFLTNP